MNTSPRYILGKITQHIAAHSGFEERRDYVSISHLADCARMIVKQYQDGYAVEAHTHQMCYAGYAHEKDLLAILTAAGLVREVNVEVVAPFDERLRGHLDAIGQDAVLELKSVGVRQWEKLTKKEDKVLWKHYVQVQMYMRYARLGRAFVIYRNRETYQHMVIEVKYNESQAAKIENKARLILEAIDEGSLPECDCGQCREQA